MTALPCPFCGFTPTVYTYSVVCGNCDAETSSREAWNRRAQHTAPPSGSVGEDVVERVAKAMRRAFDLGQQYWQDADSESYKANKRAGEWLEKFRTLNDETLAALTAAAVAAPAGELCAFYATPTDKVSEDGMHTLYTITNAPTPVTDFNLYTAPFAPAGVSPSAAQGWRLLEVGERVQQGDELYSAPRWRKTGPGDYGLVISPSHIPFRRRFATPEAAQEGGKAVAWRVRWGTTVGLFTHLPTSRVGENGCTEVTPLYTTPQDDRPAREGDAALRRAGGILSNLAFNLAQEPALSASWRANLDDARKAWDAALASTAEPDK